MNTFYGQHKHSLDAKWRVSLPAKYRKVLPETLLVRLDTEKAQFPNIRVYSPDVFDNWLNLVMDSRGGYDPLDPEKDELKLLLAATASSVNVDSAGRIGLPEDMLKAAQIGKEVVIIGASDHIRIWDEETWNRYNTEVLAKLVVFERKS